MWPSLPTVHVVPASTNGGHVCGPLLHNLHLSVGDCFVVCVFLFYLFSVSLSPSIDLLIYIYIVVIFILHSNPRKTTKVGNVWLWTYVRSMTEPPSRNHFAMLFEVFRMIFYMYILYYMMLHYLFLIIILFFLNRIYYDILFFYCFIFSLFILFYIILI